MRKTVKFLCLFNAYCISVFVCMSFKKLEIYLSYIYHIYIYISTVWYKFDLNIQRNCYKNTYILYFSYTFKELQGSVSFEHYDIDIASDTTLSRLLANADFPNNPIYTGKLINFQSASNVGSNFCIRMRALFVAPFDGQYKFSIIADDVATLHLSTDTSDENKQLLTDGNR